jgi:CheY-like chemotaxis protein
MQARAQIRKVLVVDEDPDLRRIVELTLRAVASWQVLLAESGEEGLVLAARERPDVILLDVMMPGMDGPTTLARLRAQPRTASVPVIFITAKAQKHETARYLDLGAAGVIQKPFDPLRRPGGGGPALASVSLRGWRRSMTVGEFCNRDVVIIYRESGIGEAARRMRAHHVGDLVVVEEREGSRFPTGILTDRDLVVGVLADDLEHLHLLTVGAVMTSELVTIDTERDLEEALRRMRVHGVRRLPVVDARGALVGIVAFDDLVELVAHEVSALADLLVRQRRREAQERSPEPHL